MMECYEGTAGFFLLVLTVLGGVTMVLIAVYMALFIIARILDQAHDLWVRFEQWRENRKGDESEN